MKKLLLIFFAVPLFASAQNDSSSLGMQQLYNTNKKGMLVLGSWAIGNIGIGAIGMNTSSGVDKRFHEMNLFWNTVNLALAVPGRVSSVKQLRKIKEGKWVPTAEEFRKEQRKTERLFLINTGLDIVYMGTGLYMNQKARTSGNPDLVKGYGNSIVLQGGFLFGFDAIMWLIHRKHRQQYVF
ncbi:MAG TPA: hypothetical protein DEP18_08855 [Flavobacteriales bacterium]|nr:hypothetical protein [Flavobacteriales bacterium]HRE75328.1 hypothetical protein [Flavobacteriales bacterium]HRE95843.1 hypothetical protein [Flavobacteriales bacterium]HRJ37611.1 hypothetical protein [Flavobacteriales bacterium]